MGLKFKICGLFLCIISCSTAQEVFIEEWNNDTSVKNDTPIVTQDVITQTSEIIYVAASPEIEFCEGNFHSCLDSAKKLDRMLYVDFYADWCGPCKLLDQLVFKDDSVILYSNANYIAYKANLDDFDDLELAEQYNAKSIPQILFFKHNQQLIGRTEGVLSGEMFYQILREYKDEFGN